MIDSLRGIYSLSDKARKIKYIYDLNKPLHTLKSLYGEALYLVGIL